MKLSTVRLVDATGQTFQPGGQRLDWRGWRPVTIPLDAGSSGHWGGADDGVIASGDGGRHLDRFGGFGGVVLRGQGGHNIRSCGGHVHGMGV